MLSLTKKFFCIVLLFFSTVYIFSQSASKKFQITDISYDITGMTREKALNDDLDIDRTKIFKTQKELDAYIADIRMNLNNNRVFKESEVKVSYGTRDSSGITPVKLQIRTVDTINSIIVPYPTYNSDDGLSLKIKFRNYNFLGTLKMFDLNFTYQYIIDNKGTKDERKRHFAGVQTDFTVPVKIGKRELLWNHNIDISTNFGKDKYKPYAYYGTGVGYSFPMGPGTFGWSTDGWIKHETNGLWYGYYHAGANYSLPLVKDVVSLSMAANQSYTYDPTSYPPNKQYMTSSFSVATPFTIGTIENWGTIVWTPSIALSWNWNPESLKGGSNPFKDDMISNTSIKGPTITFSHSVGSSKIYWDGNFRRGFSISLTQSWVYNLNTKAIPMPSYSLATQLHLVMPNNRVAMYNRNWWYFNMDGTLSEFADRMRGIRSSEAIGSDNVIVMNFDFPHSLLKTDWVGWGFPNFMRKIDMEIQVSPFLDVALGHNTITNTNYLIKDGYYSGGIEFLVFPKSMRSIIGRFSIGVDLARTILPTRIVGDKSWRPATSRFEGFFGIGIFY